MAQENYVDVSSLADDVSLWRRILPWHLIYDSNRQGWRPSSAAFDNDCDGGPMSVVLGDVVLAAGRKPDTVLAGHPGYAVAAITVALARACGQGVARDPLPAEPAHALVFGPKPKSIQRRLAKGSTWVISASGA
jgi:hypothetical protein